MTDSPVRRLLFATAALVVSAGAAALELGRPGPDTTAAACALLVPAGGGPSLHLAGCASGRDPLLAPPCPHETGADPGGVRACPLQGRFGGAAR